MKVLHNCAYQVEGKALCGTRGWLYNSATVEDKKIVAREAGRLSMSMAEAKKAGRGAGGVSPLPAGYDNMECQELLDLLAENQVSRCYFGHIHGQYAAQKALVGEYKGVHMRLISADYVQFCRSGWNRTLNFSLFPKFLRESCRFFAPRVL